MQLGDEINRDVFNFPINKLS